MISYKLPFDTFFCVLGLAIAQIIGCIFGEAVFRKIYAKTAKQWKAKIG
jgi:hypothetical protein